MTDKIQTFEYSEEYDAYYIVETGEWIEGKCSDPNCEYCVNRPERFIENVKAGAEQNAGDGGYGIGTQEAYEEFVKKRNESLKL
jgi:hypothetical protein